MCARTRSALLRCSSRSCFSVGGLIYLSMLSPPPVFAAAALNFRGAV
jgi:hypothetical protein